MLQHPSHQAAQGCLVLHHQNRLVATAHERLLRQLRPGLRIGFARGQEDSERGSHPEPAFHFDPAVVQLHRPVHGRQTEPGSFACLFGGEERFKNVIQRRLIHASASVADTQAHEMPGASLRVTLHVSVVDFCRKRADNQSPASQHRVARVDRQVRDQLLHHAQVSQHRRQVRSIIALQRNLLSQEAVQHLCDVANDFIQIEDFRLHHLSAAEGQQLPRQIRRAPGRAGNLLQSLQGVGRRRLLRQQ